MRSIVSHLVDAAVLAGALLAATPACALRDRPDESLFPPWQHGANNDALDRGLDFTVPDADDMADFHGDPVGAKLVLYVGGNYFFAMAPLVREFETENPAYQGHLFWETIPPGRLAEQLARNGRITVGNMTFTAKADVFLAGLEKTRELVAAGRLEGPVVPYVTNTLAIMVPKTNPAGIEKLADLARPDLRLAMPNPAFEGIARQIEAALTRAGGPSLATAVYDTKVGDGSTILTQIHHRQTPLFLMLGYAEAGVTWRSEAVFQEQAGHPIAHIDIPAHENARGIYAGAAVKGAAHPEAAKAWLAFIRSPPAVAIFQKYGFEPYRGDEAR